MKRGMYFLLLLVIGLIAGNILYADQSNEIGATHVAHIKDTLKEPFLELLASSEFITTDELDGRILRVEKALEGFKKDFHGSVIVPVPAPAPAVSPVVIVPAPSVPVAEPVPTTVATPTTVAMQIPGAVLAPTVTPVIVESLVPVVETTPTTVTMPLAQPALSPAVSAVPVPAEASAPAGMPVAQELQAMPTAPIFESPSLEQSSAFTPAPGMILSPANPAMDMGMPTSGMPMAQKMPSKKKHGKMLT